MDISDSTASTLSVQQLGFHQRIGVLLGRWWIAFSLSSICVVSGHLMIKAGLNTASATHSDSGVLNHVVHLLVQPEVFAGLAIYLFGTGCWMIAVSQKEISFLYPLSSVNYVLVAIASGVFLSESISSSRAAGILLIVLGMFLLNRPARGVCA
jgi:uncharacterized membrane protein